MANAVAAARVGGVSRGPKARLVVAAMLFLVIAAAVGLTSLASQRTFRVGKNVIVGPRYTGPVPVSPGLVATARAGKVFLPHRAGAPNQLSSVFGWVIIPRS